MKKTILIVVMITSQIANASDMAGLAIVVLAWPLALVVLLSVLIKQLWDKIFMMIINALIAIFSSYAAFRIYQSPYDQDFIAHWFILPPSLFCIYLLLFIMKYKRRYRVRRNTQDNL